jgi:UDP-N-acetylmuramyl pentapeptide synthase
MAEKRGLFERLGSGGTAVVNADDARALELVEGLPCRVVTAGRSAGADVRLAEATLRWPDGVDVRVDVRGREVAGRLRLNALHLAPLVALAIAAADAVGVSADRALAAAEHAFVPPSFTAVRGPGGSTFLLDPRSTSTTARAAVRALTDVPARRRLAVIGEIQEKPYDVSTFRPLADSLEPLDRVVAVGRAGPPLRAALNGAGDGRRLDAVERTEEVAELLDGELREGDVVLVHGARRQHLERVALLLGGERVGCRVRRCRLQWDSADCCWIESGPPERQVERA